MDDPFPASSRLLAYCRDSGGPQQELSIPQQEAKIGEWCKAHGYALVRIFKDAARSGTKVAGRDQFLEMFSYLSRDVDVAGVVIWEYARLSRDFDDSQFYLADLRRQGYGIYSLSDQIPEGLEGRLMESIIAWKNARFSADLSRNIARGIRYIITAHHAWPHVAPPPGYKKVYATIGNRRDGSPHEVARLEIDEATAPVVRHAYAMRLIGTSYREITEETRLYVYNSPIREMLSNPIYIGVYAYSGLHVENYCPPLIDRSLWERVQEINAQARARSGPYHPRSIHSTFLLSGLMTCALCGSAMIGLHTTNERRQPGVVYSYYQCSNKRWRMRESHCPARNVPAATLEGRVKALLLDVLDRPQILIDLKAELERQNAGQDAVRQQEETRARSDLAAVVRSIRNITEAIREAGHSPALLADLRELEERKEGLELDLIDIAARAPAPPQPVDITRLAADLRGAITSASERDLQRVYRLIISRLTARYDGGILSGDLTVKIGDVVQTLSL